MSGTKKPILEKDLILRLLAEADRKWFNNQPGPFNYREHLEFTAGYIAKHYRREAK